MVGFKVKAIPYGRLVLFMDEGLISEIYDTRLVPSKFRLLVLRWLFGFAEYQPNLNFEAETAAAIKAVHGGGITCPTQGHRP